jgi:tetratricopeptide (TPR) repeat protein
MIWLLALQLAGGPKEHYEHAKQAFARQNYSQAEEEVNAALHDSPYLVPALVLKARLASLAHRPDVAKSCLITAITADPTSMEAQFYLGVLLYEQNDFRPALTPLRAAQTLSPQSPLPVFYLAMTHEALADQKEALQLYKQAESLSPPASEQSAEIAVAYGRYLVLLNQAEAGMAEGRRAIAIDPKLRDAHYVLAKGLEHQADFENAAREGELALTLPSTNANASDAEIHFLLVRVYRKLNKPDLAETHLAKFLALKQATQP